MLAQIERDVPRYYVWSPRTDGQGPWYVLNADLDDRFESGPLLTKERAIERAREMNEQEGTTA